MARFRRLDVLQAMMDSGLVPVFYHKDLETAKKVARAVADGGVKVLEFTNRGDFAWQIFSALIQWCESEIPDLILGVGSVIDPGTASLYINDGANFIVGPILNAEVARTCNRRKIPYLPGCGSASEISQAEEYGVEICKIFPGKEVGGGGIREEYSRTDALDAHHADRGRGDDQGIHRGLVQGGGGLRGGRFEPDIEGADRRRRLRGDNPKDGFRPHLDQ